MVAKKEPSDEIVKRLDVLLSLIVSLPTSEGKPRTLLKQVELLSGSGTEEGKQQQPLLRNVEIARILGISQVHVGVLMNKLRKRTKRSRRPKKR